MVCIYCQHLNTAVINSRPQQRLNQVWRRRHCTNCDATFTTLESADYASAWRVIDANGALEPFHRLKLTLSLYKSLEHRSTRLADTEALVDTILSKLLKHNNDGRIAATLIAVTSYQVLQRFDKAAAVHYQAFHPVKR